jgi:hypothetical protein
LREFDDNRRISVTEDTLHCEEPDCHRRQDRYLPSPFPSSSSAYVIEWDLSTLDDALDAMLGDDPLASTRVERRDYYLGGYENGESARAFVSYLQSLTADPTPVEGVAAKLTVRAPTTQKGLQPAP